MALKTNAGESGVKVQSILGVISVSLCPFGENAKKNILTVPCHSKTNLCHSKTKLLDSALRQIYAGLGRPVSQTS